MENKKIEIIYKSVSELLYYPHNNKKHPKKQIEKIATSIKEFGFRNPILIEKDNTIIAGHGRVLAAKQLSILSVPTIVVDDLTDDQVRAFRIMDNKSAESEFDFEVKGTIRAPKLLEKSIHNKIKEHNVAIWKLTGNYSRECFKSNNVTDSLLNQIFCKA